MLHPQWGCCMQLGMNTLSALPASLPVPCCCPPYLSCPLQKSPNLSFKWLQRRVGAQVRHSPGLHQQLPADIITDYGSCIPHSASAAQVCSSSIRTSWVILCMASVVHVICMGLLQQLSVCTLSHHLVRPVALLSDCLLGHY